MLPRIAALAAASLLALPAVAAAQCEPEHAWGASDAALSAEVVRLVNEHRASKGLQPLAISRSLTRSSIWKSRHMREYGYFEHDDPAPPVARDPNERAEACGNQSWGGENIAAGYPTPEAVVQGWLDSQGHRENIENPAFTAIGVGESGRYWTQNFGFSTDDPNAPPSAAPDSVAGVRGRGTVDVLENDTDDDIEWAYVESVERPGHGSAEINPQAQSVDYEPAEGFTGTDSFEYTMIDLAGERSSATVTVTVTGPNARPRAVADVVRLSRRTGRAVIRAAANDRDADGDRLRVAAIVKAPKRGSAKVKRGRIVYKPAAGRVRRDSLVYRVSDGHGGSDTARVKIRPKR
jgi:uncharacterized protein YkwD